MESGEVVPLPEPGRLDACVVNVTVLEEGVGGDAKLDSSVQVTLLRIDCSVVVPLAKDGAVLVPGLRLLLRIFHPCNSLLLIRLPKCGLPPGFCDSREGDEWFCSGTTSFSAGFAANEVNTENGLGRCMAMGSCPNLVAWVKPQNADIPPLESRYTVVTLLLMIHLFMSCVYVYMACGTKKFHSQYIFSKLLGKRVDAQEESR